MDWSMTEAWFEEAASMYSLKLGMQDWVSEIDQEARHAHATVVPRGDKHDERAGY